MVTTRGYHADKPRLGHVVTQSGAAEVQHLDYGYDDLLNLTRRKTGWNQTEAARALGIPLRTLVHKLKALGIRKLGYAPAGESPH
ncbi:helix-turn-helix domain-containing protein [Sorangium sp. So ce1335]|uniref:helix-turn-helix domain-containing protein n=1 Tax=Sorangium sp. So ce1335 TaxID=3133335 RepID=UPI003F61ECB7